ncbi:hypothetical protein GOP47_0015373 [Adiantum capillus-veneris]|uniref:Uncharacterized protein n=1 Tax=Adiantum capillus-veneris TaxID=13818 RepID=A0A9D4UKA8_ADICA|nr:hypothetical protein GOP47_0015373 [Adiantum capillus-veneris]
MRSWEKPKNLSKSEEPKGLGEASNEDKEEELSWKRCTSKRKSAIEETDLNLEDVSYLPHDGLEDIDWKVLDPQTSEFPLTSSQPHDALASTILNISEIVDQSEEKKHKIQYDSADIEHKKD